MPRLGPLFHATPPPRTRPALTALPRDSIPDRDPLGWLVRDDVDSALPTDTFGGNQTDLIKDIQPMDNYPAMPEEHPFVIGYTSGTTGSEFYITRSERYTCTPTRFSRKENTSVYMGFMVMMSRTTAWMAEIL